MSPIGSATLSVLQTPSLWQFVLLAFLLNTGELERKLCLFSEYSCCYGFAVSVCLFYIGRNVNIPVSGLVCN